MKNNKNETVSQLNKILEVRDTRMKDRSGEF